MGESELFSKIDGATRIDGPHGWIQWKGTEVCMDVHCTCGAHTHIDAEFAYYVECGDCGALFAVGAYVKLVPVTAAEVAEVGELDRVTVVSE